MIKPYEMLDNEHIARLFGLYVRFFVCLASGDRVRTQSPVIKTAVIF